jgi:acetyl-CoA/propionyl-CoA carboxylase biotin carboxyl carrier protein
MFDTVLIANRGEIAVRVIRTLRRLGIRSIAVYSDADDAELHVRCAEGAVRLGPAPARESYLNIERVVEAAKSSGAQAVHPGYGFLAENAAFAAALADAGIAFLGPPTRAIEIMGDKIAAKNAVEAFGVPVIPGIARPGLTDAELVTAADEIGYPVLVKPSAGGGGKGMHAVHEPAGLPPILNTARREAAASFGDDTLFLERLVTSPRHIEVQILADRYGTTVHLGERECSLQRRHQKVIEEAPSPLLDAETRARIGAAAVATAQSVDYVGVGTVEFLVSADRPDEFFFMEMNTRLQVEHPVTEAVTGLDLVEWQLRVAAGEKLAFTQDDVKLVGHAIEARVYAEDPGLGFLPTGGPVLGLVEPAEARVDSGLRVGAVVGSDYDPMLAKVIAYADDRAGALRRLDQALQDTAVLGVTTNVEFLRFLLADPDVRAGNLDTNLLDRRIPEFVPSPVPDDVLVAAAAASWLRAWAAATDDLWSQPIGWRVGEQAAIVFRLRSGERIERVRISGTPSAAWAAVGGSAAVPLRAEFGGEPAWPSGGGAGAAGVGGAASGGAGSSVVVTLAGRRARYTVAQEGDSTWVAGPLGTFAVERVGPAPARGKAAGTASAELISPMPGAVIAVHAEDGDRVSEGAPIVVVEAMKMEHAFAAPTDGTVKLAVALGDKVKVGQLLATVVPPPAEHPHGGTPADVVIEEGEKP